MTFLNYRERSKDVQDGIERHVWGKQEYVQGAGSVVKVRGTDTDDEEAAVLNIGGVSFNLPKDTDTEVMLLSSSSDTNLKLAVLTIPRDKQRRWAEGSGGVQHPTDPEFALEFNDKMAHITKNKFAVGAAGEVEVRGNQVYLRAAKVIIDGELVVNTIIKTPRLTAGVEPIPGFEGSKQMAFSEAQGVLDFGDAD